MTDEEIKDLAHRFAQEMIHYKRTGFYKDKAAVDQVDRLVENKFHKIVRLLRDEGFMLEKVSTWQPWLDKHKWVIECRQALNKSSSSAKT